jgi:hypothetical protein
MDSDIVVISFGNMSTYLTSGLTQICTLMLGLTLIGTVPHSMPFTETVILGIYITKYKLRMSD